MSVKPLTELKRDLRLLFYPSSGIGIDYLLDLPYDLFIFADKEPKTAEAQTCFRRRLSRQIQGFEIIKTTPTTLLFQKNAKLFLFFFEENNQVLQYIKEDGRQIHCFVGINDGCEEGGNDECVNDLPFFNKVVDLSAADKMTYITDHSHILSNANPRSAQLHDNPRTEIIICGKILANDGKTSLVKPPSQWGRPVEYSLTSHKKSIRQCNFKSLRVTLEHDSIVDNLADLDGVYISSRCRRFFETSKAIYKPAFKGAPDFYFMPSLRQGWSTEKSITSLLELCEREEWKIVGTTAFGEGRHLGLIEALESWSGAYPQWLRIFHFDKNDFPELDGFFHHIGPDAPSDRV